MLRRGAQIEANSTKHAESLPLNGHESEAGNFNSGYFYHWRSFLRAPIYSLFHPHTQKDVVQQIFTSQRIFDVVMSSQQVTAQLLKNDSEPGSPILATDDHYKPVLLSSDQAQNIKELLGEPSSYVWGVESACTAHYGVIFNFQSGGHAVRVAFCFHCHMMGVFDGDGEDAKDVNDYVLFDPIRKQMLGMCKTMFPNSQKIQDFK
jgi:hypothetical protein